jgi:hypothetical protein
MGKQAFDKKMQAVEALRGASAADIRTALKDRNNFLVSKAAAIAVEHNARELIPDLEAAFDRFLAAKSDPQCWAENAIVKALKDLGHDDPAIFLRGLRHIQMEPVFGGQEDSAAALRGACALALPACTLDRVSILTHLTSLLADAEKTVRADAIRGMAQLPGHDVALLLRVKAICGDRAPEVTGQCFACLLDMAPADSIPFVAAFFEKDIDAAMEAASALAECDAEEALAILRKTWETHRDSELGRAILLSLGASRREATAEFLVDSIRYEPNQSAAAALRALAASRFRDEFRARAAEAVHANGDARLRGVFEREFGPL